MLTSINYRGMLNHTSISSLSFYFTAFLFLVVTYAVNPATRATAPASIVVFKLISSPVFTEVVGLSGVGVGVTVVVSVVGRSGLYV